MYTLRIPLCGALFLSLLSGCATMSQNTAQQSYETAPESNQERVWVDTDAACLAGGMFTDPDDCIALALAKRADMQVAGVSSVAGNTSLTRAHRTLEQFGLYEDKLYRGGNTCSAPAVTALARATRKQSLTVLALGPLSNVATFFACYPERAEHIDEVVAVMARRPGQEFRMQEGSTELADLNFETDQEALRVVREHASIRYVPFEAGVTFQLANETLAGHVSDRLSRRLAWWDMLSRTFWETDGMLQFDAVATAGVLWPELLTCENVRTRIENNKLVVRPASAARASEAYCTPDSPDTLRTYVLSTLTSS